MTGEELRSVVGYSVIRSAMFMVERGGEMFVFRGKGSGHGVGLSQWGARAWPRTATPTGRYSFTSIRALL